MASSRVAVALEPVSGFRAVFRGASASGGGGAGCGAVFVSDAVTAARADLGSPLNFWIRAGRQDLTPW